MAVAAVPVELHRMRCALRERCEPSVVVAGCAASRLLRDLRCVGIALMRSTDLKAWYGRILPPRSTLTELPLTRRAQLVRYALDQRLAE